MKTSSTIAALSHSSDTVALSIDANTLELLAAAIESGSEVACTAMLGMNDQQDAG